MKKKPTPKPKRENLSIRDVSSESARQLRVLAAQSGLKLGEAFDLVISKAAL